MESENNYIGVLDGFASEIGSTLEDLTLHFEDDYDTRNVRGGSFMSNISGTSWPEMEGFAHGARPLTFTNPVYFMFNGRSTQAKIPKMIPLSQFDVNNDRDKIPKKKAYKKPRKESFMHSIAGFLHKGQRKHSSDMNVTSPTIDIEHADRRHSDMAPRPDTQIVPKEEKQNRSASLETTNADEKTLKKPPAKSPRLSRIIHPQEIPDTDTVVKEETKKLTEKPEPVILPSNNESNSPMLPKLDSLSDLPELDVENKNVKTISEVMRECDGDITMEHDEVTDETMTTEVANSEPGLMKRNKTVKWAGSRVAPNLIREFTKKNKNKQHIQTDADFKTPTSSSNTTPINRISTDDIIKQADDVINTSDDVIPVSESSSQVDLIDKVAVDVETKTKAKDTSAFTMLSLCLPPAPKLKRSSSSKVRSYLHKMGSSEQYALGYAVSEFVRQTLKHKEHRPLVLLHNIRSFLSDIKRYLLTNPNVGLIKRIQKISKDVSRVDVDGAVDDALEQLVLYPLHSYIYKTLVVDYTISKQLDRIKDALEIAKSKSPKELGIRETLLPPSDEHMVEIRSHFKSLQSTYSPYYKLKELLSAVTAIYMHTRDLKTDDRSARNIGADDFLPLLVYSIVKCDFIAADIEAQFIDGLLDPVLLLGEGGYYLTTLFSAVQVLSSMKRKDHPVPHISDLQSFLKVGIAATDKLISPKLTEVPHHKTLHVPPSMTARSLCAMIARKYEVSELSLYGLHVVVNGVAHELKPNEFPQLVKMDLLCQFPPNAFYFVYQKKDDVPMKKSDSSEDVFVNEEEKFEENTLVESQPPQNGSSVPTPALTQEEDVYEFAAEFKPYPKKEHGVNENEYEMAGMNNKRDVELSIETKDVAETRVEDTATAEEILTKQDIHETEESLDEIDAAIEEINTAVQSPTTDVAVDEGMEDRNVEQLFEERLKQSEKMKQEKSESYESIDLLDATIDNDTTLIGIEVDDVACQAQEDEISENEEITSVEPAETLQRPNELIKTKPHIDISPSRLISPIPVEELPSPPPLLDIDTFPSPPSPSEIVMTQSWDSGLDNTGNDRPSKTTSTRKVTRHSSVSARSDIPALDPFKCNTLPKGRDPSELTVSSLRKYFESQSAAPSEEK